MDNREADAVPDQLQRRVQEFLDDASSERAIFDAGGSVLLGTSVGKVRQKNEDRAIVVRASYAREPERDFLLAALSDGMGGLANGEEAAIVALSTFVARTIRTSRMSPERRLDMAAMAANEAVYRLYKGRGGATLSAVLIERRFGPLGVNVGDSRIYLLRDSVPELLSRDDTLGEYIKDRGVFGEADRTGSLIQYIGIGDGLEPHLLHLGPRGVDYSFVLTSDGVHRNKEMFNTVTRETRETKHLVDHLLSLADLLGGHDNATAIVIPGHMEFEYNRSSEFSLILEFCSPFKETEIWITEIGDRAERNHFIHGGQHANAPPRSEPELIEPEPRSTGSDDDQRRDDPPARNSRRSRKARKALGKDAPPKDDNQHQQARIEFPKVD